LYSAKPVHFGAGGGNPLLNSGVQQWREVEWGHGFSLAVTAHPGRSLMLQAFTGMSKVEKAQRNRCQTSPSKNSDNKANKQIADKKRN
jgi:hypothetical protein